MRGADRLAQIPAGAIRRLLAGSPDRDQRGDGTGSAPPPTVEARLALLEFFLGCDDLVACTRHAATWLVQTTGVEQVLSTVLELEGRRLVTVAAAGIRPPRAEEFSLDAGNRALPLVRVLTGTATYFPRGGRQPRTPLESTGYWAIPLRGQGVREEDGAVGLLFVSAPRPELSDDLRWFAEILGQKVANMRGLQASGPTRSSRERALLYNIINAVIDPILLTDVEGKLIIANARAEKLFAAPDDASEGRRRAVGMNNMLFSAALASHAVEEGEASRRELLLVDPIEGSDLLFELLSSPVRDPSEGTGVVSILRNVTDLGRAMQEIEDNYRKLRVAEAEVRAERHRLDLIIDSVADPILVTDPAGDLVLMNAPAEKLFSVPDDASDEAQRHVRANEAHFTSFVSNLLFQATSSRYAGEINLVDPTTGASMPVEAIAGKMLSEMGELTAVVTILHDRTEAIEKARLYEQLKHASEELEAKVQAATAELAEQNELLRRQAIELEQASQLKSQFLANMSHEFRTPLNAILGYTQMVLAGVSGELEPSQKKSLQRIDSNGRHLLALINDILDITKIEAGRMPLHLSEFSLAELVREVFAELEPIITRSRLQVTSDVAIKLPPLRSDRQKVKQIVLNLLSNALKFTHEGSVCVTAVYSPLERHVAVTVADTGIGIGRGDMEKVFEDFRQLDNTLTRPYSGTGLGLSICRRLATMLDGKILLESQVGEGSRFTVILPTRPRRR